MKKYLVMVMALAISGVFVGCHEEEFGTPFIEQKKALFEETFIKAFGQPDSTHNWGFRMREDVTRGAYPNGNMWESEGWNVPPVLSAGQKERVYKYFQCHTPIGYTDPGWTNYWIQQVYKGHTDPNNSYSKTKEEYTSANNGQVIGGDHMDHLAAIGDGKFDHIYDFNNSDNNDWEGRMLMTNSTTKSFGYFNSDGSLGHTEYTGLVHWSVIDEWGEKEKVGASLNDGWNRSFMGFDFEQVVGEDIYAGEAVYTCPAFDGYIWDGTDVIQVAEQDPAQNYKLVYKSGYEHMTYQDADGTTKKVYFLTAETNQYCGILSKKGESDVVIEKNGHKCVDMVKITGYLRDGYLPVSGSDMKDWVKVQGGADGYYSDWIVTLCEAKSAGNEPKPKVWEIGQNGNPEPRYVVEGRKVVESGRVMCEDLAGATGKFDDMDYNDVVFDAVIVNEYRKLVTEDDEDIIDNSFDSYNKTYAKVRLMAAGGTIPVDLIIKDKNGKKYTFDVHETLEAPDNVMINTLSENEDNSYLGGATVVSRDPVTLKNDDNDTERFDDVEYISDITLDVLYNNVSTELKAVTGGATYMFLVPLGVKWARERSGFGVVYPYFDGWVHDKNYNSRWYNIHVPELLYDEGLEGLTEADENEYETKEWYDNNGGSFSYYKTLESTNSSMVFPNTASETVLFDFTKSRTGSPESGPGYLCPEITTASGHQDEEYVSIPGSSSIKVNDIIRIYGVYLSDWYIETNFSDKITSDNGKGYIDIPVTSNYINNINSNNWSSINVTGKHFTVTYITVRSGD